MKVINLFGGPGTGKSTVASDLFAYMKWNNMSVELINEYAKELTWEKHHNILNDQLYVLANQNRKLERLRGQVDYVIADSPIIMGLVYVPPNYFKGYETLIGGVWNSYDNINIFLNRLKPYHPIGRKQNEEEAISLDKKIKLLLDITGSKYIEVPGDQGAKHKIADYVFNRESHYGTDNS